MRRSRSGFSVIEAVVAIAIAAIGLTAILGLQQQLARSQAREEAALNRHNIRRAAIVLVRDINPYQRPTGQNLIAPGLSVSWTSEAIVRPIQGLGFGGAPSAFQVGLYNVTVQIEDANHTVLDQFTVERLGWKRLEDVSLY